MQVTWKRRAFVNQIRFSKRFCKPDSFEQTIPILGDSMVRQTKSGKYSSSYLFLSLSGQVVYFHEDYYCTNFSHYLQIIAKVLQNMCLKNLFFFRKIPGSESLFNQPTACYFFNERLWPRCFFENFGKLSRTPFLQGTLKLLLLCLWNIYVM